MNPRGEVDETDLLKRLDLRGEIQVFDEEFPVSLSELFVALDEPLDEELLVLHVHHARRLVPDLTFVRLHHLKIKTTVFFWK